MTTGFIAPNFDGIPSELRRLPRWVTWLAESDGGNTKPRKTPYRADLPHTRASSTDPDSWCSFEQAEAAYLDGNRTGIGLVLDGTGDLAGVDIDGCRDAESGIVDRAALALLDGMGAAYVEVSPSGTGLRAFGYAPPLATGCAGTLDGLKLELYSKGRYLTLTGQTIKAGPLGPLRGFGELAERVRANRKVNHETGEIERSAPDEHHAELVRRIQAGDVFHDSLRDLAASMVATGMQAGAVVNHLRALMDTCTAPHDGRWRTRRGQIPALVSTAAAKYEPTNGPGKAPKRVVAGPSDVVATDAPYVPEDAAQRPPFVLLPVADLGTAEVPPQVWLLAGYIPAGTLTLLGAHGGTGKSTIALMLAVCTALGIPLFAVPTQAAPVVFFSAEDDADTVRRRVQAVCRALHVDPALLLGRLHILDATANAPELFAPVYGADGSHKPGITPMGLALADYVAECKAGLLIVDNASDTMGGNENARPEVRAFVRLLVGMVRDHGGAVLLLAHIDKNTAKGLGGGQSYSGSTAWHNSARSRLFLSRDKDGDTLVLEHQESNYGPMCEPLRLVWPHGGLPQLDSPLSGVVQAIATGNDTKVVLRLVHEFTERGEFVSTATTGPGQAGKLLRGQSAFPQRLSDTDLHDLLRRAHRRGWLNRVHFRKVNRHPGERWEVTAAGASAAEITNFAPGAPVAPVAVNDAAGAGGKLAAPVAPVGARGCGGDAAHTTGAASDA